MNGRGRLGEAERTQGCVYFWRQHCQRAQRTAAGNNLRQKRFPGILSPAPSNWLFHLNLMQPGKTRAVAFDVSMLAAAAAIYLGIRFYGETLLPDQPVAASCRRERSAISRTC